MCIRDSGSGTGISIGTGIGIGALSGTICIWHHLIPSGSLWQPLAASGTIWAPRQSDLSPGARKSKKSMHFCETVNKSWFLVPEVMIIDGRCWHLAKIRKICGNYKWEVLTFAKSSGHFTRCFGSQVHQVLCLCSEEPRGRRARSSAMTGVLFIFELEPHMLKTYLGNEFYGCLKANDTLEAKGP